MKFLTIKSFIILCKHLEGLGFNSSISINKIPKIFDELGHKISYYNVNVEKYNNELIFNFYNTRYTIEWVIRFEQGN